jgi:ribosomal protein S15P/S13E
MGHTEVQGACLSVPRSRVSLTGFNWAPAALLTLQTQVVEPVCGEFKCDVADWRNLRRPVRQRAKLLKYLEHTNQDRYERVRLGLAPALSRANSWCSVVFVSLGIS